MRAPVPKQIRFPVDPRDVDHTKVARRLGLPEAEFLQLRDRLFARDFPRPDADTGNYDLKAIECWMDRRSGLTNEGSQRLVSALVRGRVEKLVGGARRKT